MKMRKLFQKVSASKLHFKLIEISRLPNVPAAIEARALAVQEELARHVVQAEGVVGGEDERAVEAASVRHHVVHVHHRRRPAS